MKYRIGYLNSGGDCAGLNTVNTELALKIATTYGEKAVAMGLINGQQSFAEYANGNKNVIAFSDRNGIKSGALGILTKFDFLFDARSTFLGTQSTSSLIKYLENLTRGKNIPYEQSLKSYDQDVVNGIEKMNLHGLFATGGNGSMKNLHNLMKSCKRSPLLVGISKTIDNDNPGSEESIGFLSGITHFAQNIRGCLSHANSHRRGVILQGFGRDTGHFSLYAGMGGGADIIILPEYKWDIKEIIATAQERTKAKGYVIMVVAEGAGTNMDIGKFESATKYIAHHVRNSGIEIRTQDQSYASRGVSPTVVEILLATELSQTAFNVMVKYLAASKKEQAAFPKSVMVGKANGRATVYDLAKLGSGTRFVEDDDKMLGCALANDVYIGTRDDNGNLIRNKACPPYVISPQAIISVKDFFSKTK
ncbi:MAG: 6-phosphofructokinase [Alphaproteobacteria bacterium]|nr:6-phosphofructokinase [Alphaproteobacteria bacterium]